MTAAPTVFIVDDDKAMCSSLQWLVESIRLPTESYPGAREYLSSFDDARPGCLLLDIRMPGMSGLDLQAELVRRGALIPVIIVTGHGDVPVAVRAMKAGAFDFIEKPFRDGNLLGVVQKALAADAKRRRAHTKREARAQRLASLTLREQEVVQFVVAGESSRQIAARLGLSEKTIEYHRGQIMKRLNTGSVAELVRVVL